MFESIVVKDREIVKMVYQEPFKTLLGRKGSNKRNLVELRRFELLTSTMPWWRSTN